MAASVPGPLARAQGLAGSSSQTLHSQKLFRLRPGGQTSGLDAQLHPCRGLPPLPLCAAGAGSGDPPSPQKWPPPGRSALSGGTSFAKGVPPPAPLVPRAVLPKKLVALGWQPAVSPTGSRQFSDRIATANELPLPKIYHSRGRSVPKWGTFSRLPNRCDARIGLEAIISGILQLMRAGAEVWNVICL